MKQIILVLISIILGSCQLGTKKENITDDIIKIDISKKYPSKKIKINLLDREYIPLETNKKILLGMYATLDYISEKYILIYGDGNIWIFNRKGQIVSHFNHKGKGPGEYKGIWSVVFDEKKEEIFVFDNYGGDGTGLILVYSIEGKYKRTLRYPENMALTAYNFDDKTMLVYDTKDLYIMYGNDSPQKTYRTKPYMLLSKADGSIVSTLNIDLPDRYPPKLYEQFTAPDGQLFTSSYNININNKRHFGEDFIISDISSDTIYHLSKNGNLKPFIVRTPSVHSTNKPLVCTPIIITEKFIILSINTIDYEEAIKLKNSPTKTLMYEFETGEIYDVDYDTYYFDINFMQKNIDALLVDAWRFKEFFEENYTEKFADSLNNEGKKKFDDWKQINNNLDDEDNPIVIIYHFK